VPSTRRRLAGPTLTALLVAACGAAPTQIPAPATPLPAPTLPAGATPSPPGPTLVPTPSVSLPPFDCAATLQRPGSEPVALVAGLDAVNADGIGRITFAFRPEGTVAVTPEVEVRPAAPPFVQDPSGLPLEVAGSAFVVIILRDATSVDANGNPTFSGPFDIRPRGGPIVEMRRAGDFEALSTFVIGLDGSPCVRILPPDGSGRVVIEITTT
jgi:hypothetical protein